MFNRYDEFRTHENSWLHTSDYQFEHEMNDHSKEELFAQLAQLNKEKIEKVEEENKSSALSDFAARGRITSFNQLVLAAKLAAIETLCIAYDRL